jgi:hypothetical protein
MDNDRVSIDCAAISVGAFMSDIVSLEDFCPHFVATLSNNNNSNNTIIIIVIKKLIAFYLLQSLHCRL